jgi:hypothetical protein
LPLSRRRQIHVEAARLYFMPRASNATHRGHQLATVRHARDANRRNNAHTAHPLVVEDDESIGDSLVRFLDAEVHIVNSASTAAGRGRRAKFPIWCYWISVFATAMESTCAGSCTVDGPTAQS